jgi:molybdopterin molybdotransferase
MAQLSDDCFAFGGPLLPVDEALAMLADRLSAVEGTEEVSLVELDGRVLAHDLIASMPLPPFTNSAVDGYALDGAEIPIAKAGSFRVAGRIQVGASATVAASPGETVRVFTGAPMPAAMDTVFMQEDVQVEGDSRVTLPPGLKRGANVRPAGEDIGIGQVALKAGHRMRPQDVALAAAFGFALVEVRRRVRVAVLSTGNEIVAPGTARGAAQLFDSNRFMLISMLARLGCAVEDLGILGDDRDAIAATLSAAAGNNDLILASGGVSTGEADYVKAAVEGVGKLVFWRLGIKPGRPVAMGVIGGTPFIGLPGNPVASFVTFTHIARPAIMALSGTPFAPPITVPSRAAFTYNKKAGRREYVRVRLRNAADGALEAVKFPREGAGLLSSLVDTDGLIELGEEITTVQPGQSVAFLPYSILL